MAGQTSVDERIARLSPEVDAPLRAELESVLRTLRDAGNPVAVIVELSRLSLLLLDRVFSAAGTVRTSDNLYQCILRAGAGKDRDPRVEGLRLVPRTILENLDTIRRWSNPLDHADPTIPEPTSADGENAIGLFLRVLEWFSCDYQHGPRMASPYSELASPVSLKQELEQLRRDLLDRYEQRSWHTRREAAIVGLRFLEADHGFRDRVDEADALRKLLGDQTVKLICVVGRGGFGKTSLLSRVCSEIERGNLRLSPETSSGADGIVYVSCRGSHRVTLQRLVDDLGRMLGSPHDSELHAIWSDPQRSLEDKISTLLGRLRRGCYLLVLDNLEDALGPDSLLVDPDLQAFIEACTSTPHALRLLVTSRAQVVVRGPGARAARSIPLDRGLPLEEAVHLLRELDPTGTLGLKSAPDAILEPLCRRCHGIPRALEMVAGILISDPLATPEALLHDQELSAAQVVKGLVEDHFQRIGDSERLVMQALAVYNLPVPRVAVRFMLQDLAPEVDVDTTLARLVRSFFVSSSRARGTFELHPIDQQHAYDVLVRQGHETCRRWYRRAASFWRELRPPREQWSAPGDLEPLLEEFNHLVAADELEAAFALYREAQPLLSDWGSLSRVATMSRRLLGSPLPPHLEAAVWLDLGDAHVHLGDLTAAEASFTEAQRLADALGEAPALARAVGGLGTVLMDRGRPDEAIPCFSRALSISDDRVEPRQRGTWRLYLGQCHLFRSRFDQALDLWAEALSDAVQRHDPYLEVVASSWPARALVRTGRTREALELARNGVDLARDGGFRRLEVYRLIHLAEIRCETGLDLGRVEEDALDALRLAEELEDSQGVMKSTRALADVLHLLGEAERSERLLVEALEAARRSRRSHFEVSVRTSMAEVLLTLDRVDAAVAVAEEALRLAEGLGDLSARAICRCVLGAAISEQGDLDQARDTLTPALDQAVGSRDALTMGRAAGALAEVELAGGPIDVALAHLETASDHAAAPLASRATVLLGLLADPLSSDARQRLARGEVACRELLGQQPRLLSVALDLALAEAATGATERALGTLSAALLRRPQRTLLKRLRRDLGLAAAHAGVHTFLALVDEALAATTAPPAAGGSDH